MRGMKHLAALGFAAMLTMPVMADRVTVTLETDKPQTSPPVLICEPVQPIPDKCGSCGEDGASIHDCELVKQPFPGQRASVDLAILLDTSNSMDGLIDQAKRQLWTIVGQFAKAQKAGQTPLLRVALFEYGNTSLPANEGYLRQVVPLTDDLDKLSQALFALTTNGGDEYCGQVIDEAVKRLDWSGEPNAYKTIFIAGNEPFTQGPVPYQEACRGAIEKGVVVNTIHCGDYQAGINGQWNAGATMAEGKYLNINQDRAVVHIDAPQDEIIIKLNTQLNDTYLWYGKGMKANSANQVAQDDNAAKLGKSVLVERAAAKSSSVYDNRGRDLVDEWKRNDQAIGELEEGDLPEPLRDMDDQQRTAHVKAMAEKRAALQERIKALSTEREAYLAKERLRLAESGEATLGDAVLDAVVDQLKDRGFELESEEVRK